jgi:hypothetical protein
MRKHETTARISIERERREEKSREEQRREREFE